MARWTKRRKARVLWLPTYGSTAAEGDDAIGVAGQIVLTAGASDIRWDAFPVTYDYSESAPGITNKNLHDLTSGNAWKLRRIVGKAFLWNTFTFASSEQVPPLIDCAVGFMVCRTDDEGEIPTTNFDEVNPLAQTSAEDPWVWRRRWLLGIPGFGGYGGGNVLGVQAAGFPASTAGYGSVADGPHIDSKMQRLIQREQRLYCVIAARAWSSLSGNTPGSPAPILQYLIDYRLLGTMINQAGNRRNASR